MKNKFIRVFEEFSALSVHVYDMEQLFNRLYDGSELKDKTVYKRIRYFSGNDFNWSQRDTNPYYVSLEMGDKVIGLAKVGYYSMSARNENNYSISFFSIDKDFRGNKYSRLMADKLFAEAKKRGLEISTSSYTVLGKEHLQHLFNEYADKHRVVFYDKTEDDFMHDTEREYVTVNGKKLHRSEIEESAQTNTVSWHPDFLRSLNAYKNFYENYTTELKNLKKDIELAVENIMNMGVDVEKNRELIQKISKIRQKIESKIEMFVHKCVNLHLKEYLYNENRMLKFNDVNWNEATKEELQKALHFLAAKKDRKDQSYLDIARNFFKEMSKIHDNIIMRNVYVMENIEEDIRNIIGFQTDDTLFQMQSDVYDQLDKLNFVLPEFPDLPEMKEGSIL